jgi:hypothetical protein
MRIGRGNRSTRRRPAPLPLCPPQTLHYLIRDGTRTAAVGSQWLTAWAMARPTMIRKLAYWRQEECPHLRLYLEKKNTQEQRSSSRMSREENSELQFQQILEGTCLGSCTYARHFGYLQNTVIVRQGVQRKLYSRTKTKLHGFSPQANYTDRLSDCRLSAKLVPTLVDRGCRVVSATIPPQSLISVF